jgi:hypothetical protein
MVLLPMLCWRSLIACHCTRCDGTVAHVAKVLWPTSCLLCRHPCHCQASVTALIAVALLWLMRMHLFSSSVSTLLLRRPGSSLVSMPSLQRIAHYCLGLAVWASHGAVRASRKGPNTSSLASRSPKCFQLSVLCAGCWPIPGYGGPLLCPEGHSRRLVVVELVLRANACKNLSLLELSLSTILTEKPCPPMVGILVYLRAVQVDPRLGAPVAGPLFLVVRVNPALALGAVPAFLRSMRKANASGPCCSGVVFWVHPSIAVPMSPARSAAPNGQGHRGSGWGRDPGAAARILCPLHVCLAISALSRSTRKGKCSMPLCWVHPSAAVPTSCTRCAALGGRGCQGLGWGWNLGANAPVSRPPLSCPV